LKLRHSDDPIRRPNVRKSRLRNSPSWWQQDGTWSA
jgi:hypothetical protein